MAVATDFQIRYIFNDIRQGAIRSYQCSMWNAQALGRNFRERYVMETISYGGFCNVIPECIGHPGDHD